LAQLSPQLTPAALPTAPAADDATAWQTMIELAQQIAHI